MDKAEFHGNARFDAAEFLQPLWLSGAHFYDDASFIGTIFRDVIWLDGTRFDGSASFSEAQFNKPDRLGPLRARRLGFDHATFRQNITIEAAASEVVCDRTVFEAGGTLRFRYASVSFRGAVFNSPSSLSGADQPYRLVRGDLDESGLTPPSSEQDGIGERLVLRSRPARQEPAWIPTLSSLQGADVADLSIADTNVEYCRFVGAHHLDQIRLEAPGRFSYPPRPRRLFYLARLWPPVIRWTRRQVIAEERIWRYSKYPRSGWLAQERVPTGSADTTAARLAELEGISAARIAGIYRLLRKAFEDNKNEPGAADFYYGEMEMRRLSSLRIERWLLTAYWLLSGYGLRATRALVSLIVALCLATVLFATIGFASSVRTEYRPIAPASPGQAAVYEQVTVPGPRPGWSTAASYSLEGATSLLRPTQLLQPLTPAGEGVQIALRLLGPLLLGLAILAIRNRVKR